jgi:hypothetical protein
MFGGKANRMLDIFRFPLETGIGFRNRKASGDGLAIFTQQKFKTGVTVYQFICSIGGTRRGRLPGRDPAAKASARQGGQIRLPLKRQAFPSP